MTDAEPQPAEPVRIEPEQLAPDTLRSVVEEFVTRDGSDLTRVDERVRRVLSQLERGEVELWFDLDSRTCNVLPRGTAG